MKCKLTYNNPYTHKSKFFSDSEKNPTFCIDSFFDILEKSNPNIMNNSSFVNINVFSLQPFDGQVLDSQQTNNLFHMSPINFACAIEGVYGREIAEKYKGKIENIIEKYVNFHPYERKSALFYALLFYINNKESIAYRKLMDTVELKILKNYTDWSNIVYVCVKYNKRKELNEIAMKTKNFEDINYNIIEQEGLFNFFSKDIADVSFEKAYEIFEEIAKLYNVDKNWFADQIFMLPQNENAFNIVKILKAIGAEYTDKHYDESLFMKEKLEKNYAFSALLDNGIPIINMPKLVQTIFRAKNTGALKELFDKRREYIDIEQTKILWKLLLPDIEHQIEKGNSIDTKLENILYILKFMNISSNYFDIFDEEYSPTLYQKIFKLCTYLLKNIPNEAEINELCELTSGLLTSALNYGHHKKVINIIESSLSCKNNTIYTSSKALEKWKDMFKKIANEAKLEKQIVQVNDISFSI